MSTGDVENHLSQWFKSPLGRYVLRFEKELFDDAVKDVFGYNAVQIGLSERNFLELNRISNQVIISGGLDSSISADLSLLPIKSSSVDLVLLPHTLECSSDPHAVVREVERILVPGGRVVISSLNPFSLFGLRYRCWGVKEGPAKCKELVSLARIKDWLKLVSIEVESGRMGCYSLPFQSEKWRERFGFLEFAGDRWWPIFGAVYFLQGIKKVRGMRLVMPNWGSFGYRKKVAPTPRREVINHGSE